MSQSLEDPQLEESTPDEREDLTLEIGQYGLRRPSGYVQEDYEPQLRGKRGAQTFTKMGNDEIAGAVLFAIEQIMSQVEIKVEAAGESSKEEEDAEFLKGCLEDMSRPFSETFSEILSMLQYGWSYHEIVYKIRGGTDSKDPRFKSRFDDQKIGWRKWAIRGQDSLLKWNYVSAEVDELLGLTQIPPPSYKQVFIPLSKSLLFRPKSHKNNPEGRSIFRSAYKAWYYKENLQKIEAIGVERDLAGLPVMKVPPQLFNQNASANDKAQLENCKKIVRNIRIDEQHGVVVPASYDQNGNELYKLELLSSGGSKQMNTNEIINRYDQRIAMSVLADFILLGHEGVGSYSLADSKTSIFTMAIKSWLDAIVDVINRDAIPKLWEINGWPLEGLPKVVYGDIENIDIEKLGKFLQTITSAGMPLFPDEGLEEHLRTIAGLPGRTVVTDTDLDDDPADNDDNDDAESNENDGVTEE